MMITISKKWREVIDEYVRRGIEAKIDIGGDVRVIVNKNGKVTALHTTTNEQVKIFGYDLS